MAKEETAAGQDYQPDLITLEDEDGQEVTFEVIDAADHKDVHYLAVVPYLDPKQALEEDQDLILLRVDNDEEGEFLNIVDDDEELYEVGRMFEKRLADYYDIDYGASGKQH